MLFLEYNSSLPAHSFEQMWNFIVPESTESNVIKDYTSFPEPNGKGELTGLVAFEDTDTRSRREFAHSIVDSKGNTRDATVAHALCVSCIGTVQFQLVDAG